MHLQFKSFVEGKLNMHLQFKTFLSRKYQQTYYHEFLEKISLFLIHIYEVNLIY